MVLSSLTAAAQARKPIPKPVPKAMPVASTAPQLKPGYITGRVTNAAGQPLAEVTVSVYGTTIAGANTQFEVTTNAQGLYSQRLPEGIYGASAYYATTYNGQSYKFTLAPTDGVTAKQHDSAEGIRKDFVWRIAGLKPKERAGTEGAYGEANKYFGNSVQVTTKAEGFGGDRVYIPAGATLQLTLTPRGPLIDGTTGQPKIFRRTLEKDLTGTLANWYLTDVPVGQYTLQSVLLLPDGTKKELKATVYQSTTQAELTPALDFKPTQFGNLKQEQVTLEP